MQNESREINKQNEFPDCGLLVIAKVIAIKEKYSGYNKTLLLTDIFWKM